MSDYSALQQQLGGENTGFDPSAVLEEKINEGKEYSKQLYEAAGTVLTGRAAEQGLKALYKSSNILKNIGLNEEDLSALADSVKSGDTGKIMDALQASGKKITKKTAQAVIDKVKAKVNEIKPDLPENPAQISGPSVEAGDLVSLPSQSLEDLAGDSDLARAAGAANKVFGGGAKARFQRTNPFEEDLSADQVQLAKTSYLDPTKITATAAKKPIESILKDEVPDADVQEFLNPQATAESDRIGAARATLFENRRAAIKARQAAKRDAGQPTESKAGNINRADAVEQNEASLPERVNPADQTGGINPEDLPDDAGFQRGSARISAKTDGEPAEPVNPFSIKRFKTPEPPEEPPEEFSSEEQLGRIKSKLKGLDRETREKIRDKALEGEEDGALDVPIDQVPKRIADKMEDLAEKTQARKQELDSQQPEPEPKEEEPEEEPEGFGPDGPEDEDEELESKQEDLSTEEDPGNVSSEITKGSDEVEDAAKTGLKAFEDVTKGIAEDPVDDFDPAGLIVQGVAGIASLVGGLFVKTRKPEFVKPEAPTLPTSIGIEVGGGTD